jgi:hypothetical protein
MAVWTSGGATKRTGIACAVLLASLGLPPWGRAGEPPSGSLDAICAIDLESQPLGDSLRDLARQAHLQLMFEAAVAADQRSPAVQGRLSPRAALRRLLAHTGLDATELAPGIVVIRRRTSR